METQNGVTLGERRYVAASLDDMAFPQYAWVSAASERAGLGQEMIDRLEPLLDGALSGEKPVTEQQASAFVRAIVNRAYENGAYLDLLAGLLVEEGVEWSEEYAEETKEALRKLKGVENVSKVSLVLGEAVLSFFWSAVASMTTFQKSSALPDVVAKVLKGTTDRDLENALETFES